MDILWFNWNVGLSPRKTRPFPDSPAPWRWHPCCCRPFAQRKTTPNKTPTDDGNSDSPPLHTEDQSAPSVGSWWEPRWSNWPFVELLSPEIHGNPVLVIESNRPEVVIQVHLSRGAARISRVTSHMRHMRLWNQRPCRTCASPHRTRPNCSMP